MTRSFRVGRHVVGDDAPVFVVAELSANHAGSRDTALRTIEAAAKSGADAIKLQTYTPDTITLRSDAPPFVVKIENQWEGRTLHGLYAEAMTPWEWHRELKEAADSLGLELFSTPFDATAVAFLADLGVEAYKVASFELADLPLVEAIASQGRPVILSTGMASLGHVESALAACRAAGNHELALLRCVSSYPARPDCMNLRSFDVLRSFGVIVGLSDHTRDDTVAIASVALGAKIIEKHFILDRAVGGPDAFFSLEPAEFRRMVDAVRAAERALGPPRFGVAPDEAKSALYRRSLFVAKDVRAGDVLTCENVRSVRPAHGLAPRHLPAVLGRRATRDLAFATPLAWDMVGPEPAVAEVALRPATRDDAAALLAWRNDPETRAASRSQAAVSPDEHLAWLDRQLARTDGALLVAEREGAAVGQVRLDPAADGTTEVSLTVAPEHRGRGLAEALLRAAEAHARAAGRVRLSAWIRAGNERSVRAFRHAGYYGFTEHARPDGAYWRCERRIAPYGP